MLTALLLLSLLQTQDSTTPPPTAKPAYTTEGRGVQIYRCTLQASTYAWVFQSPEATLIDPITHQQVGTHGAGPVWIWKDGSGVTGKVIQKSPSPDAASIPWLLLAATPTGTSSGALTSIKLVRRSDTQGGNAPTSGCDAQHADTTLRVPYTATYTFYTTR
jgi:FtsP/CotA-like multicopper oxidase with cupredoxin domain